MPKTCDSCGKLIEGEEAVCPYCESLIRTEEGR